MTYSVNFTETTNPAKPSITVTDQSLNTETSLKFIGKNYAGYGPVIAENFLHLLENFARNTPPGTLAGEGQPVQGQLWYDNSAGVNLLKVYDGTSWTAAGSVKKASESPSVTSSIKGDLWVDTDNQQLYVFSGSSWLLIGPQYSAGLKTGPEVETIVDTNNVSHNVVTIWIEANRLAIISNQTFTPKVTLAGFTFIGKGYNLSSVGVNSTTEPSRIWGVAAEADALRINNATVAASNFLRSDILSTSNNPINIRNNSGISIGNDLGFTIATDANTAILYSKTSGNSIDFKINSGTPTTVLHIDGITQNIGVGAGNTSPREALDVDGNAYLSGKLIVQDTTDSSISTPGGLTVGTTAVINGNTTLNGTLFLNNLDELGNQLGGSIILPGTASASANYDIGSDARPFRNVYANNFVGAFNGSFTGTLEGSITGSAAKLASPTVFSITGDVATTVPISFNGQTTTGTAVFNTTLTQDVITGKDPVANSLPGDKFLIYRSGTNGGLKSTTKQDILSNVPLVPVGVIFPYAGLSPDTTPSGVLPSGYLLCDGSEVLISDYPELFNVIGFVYKPASALIGRGTFALPDLRGRFPLGRDNMDNRTSVLDADGISRDAGGGTPTPSRVSDATADVVGAASGSERYVLKVENLPDHKHNLNSGTAQYYAAGVPGGTPDGAAQAGYGLPNTSTGYGYPSSGSLDSTSISQPIPMMNPYLTINYIIFTGKI